MTDFSHTFSVPKPIDQVWNTMTQLDQVLPMVPDTSVTEGTGAKVTAQIKLRLGSMTMQYTGPAEIIEKNDASHSAVMTAQAREKGGQGNADARVAIQLTSAGGSTNGTLKSSINVTGKAAQMGEGMVGPVTDALIKGFVANLQKM
ncbi:MAG: SRPBCC family protein [Solirubrobacteraceae bacterium]